ncbi:glycosyltransferase family 2 protein [Noviherbaspirillum sp.]|mgnify:CR=1 FL=1|uniref:glycosyltransferase family 2 protein n=1 Tax=Noviherbaspirillum sp. TaxID=1926288 RepID=UPI002FE4240B
MTAQTSLPSISVVVPLYNKGEYVDEALSSALAAQGILEVIVVDDESTDDGPERVARMSDPRIRLIRQKNQGVSAARNRGIHEARGDFIAFLDADDCWLPDYIPAINRLIQAHPEAGMFATRYYSFSEEGQQEVSSLPQPASGAPAGEPQLVTRFFESWATGNFFFTCSVVIPRRIFVEHNIFFPPNESLGEDQDVWFRVAELYPVAYCASPLVGYRIGAFPSLSKAATGTELPPFIRRLKERFDGGRIPPQHRKGVSHLLGRHQLMLAMKHMRFRGWTEGIALLFNKLSIQAPKIWIKVFLLACLPRPIRLRILDRT